MFTRITNHFSVRLFSFGWDIIKPARWRDQEASSVFWTLYQNDLDGAFVKVGQATTALRAGENYLIPPGCRYDYWCNRPIGHLFIFFDILGFSRMAISRLFPEPIQMHLSPTPAQAMADIAAHSQPQVSLVAQWGCMGAITEGLMRAFAVLPPEQLKQGQYYLNDETPVTSALQHIEANLAERLTNGQLAARCSMSEDYFIRRFRGLIGQTPTQYVLEARVRRAAELLLFSELSLEEIASQVGFGNRHYFSRVFARQMGLGPSAYRKARLKY